MTIIFPKEMENFKRILAEQGYTNDNFELTTQEDPLPANGEIGALTGHETVKNRESGIERTYQAGHRTAWVAEFGDDLKAGAFNS